MIGTDTYAMARRDVYVSHTDEHRRRLHRLSRGAAEATAFGSAARVFGGRSCASPGD